jgi:choline-sulfatase
MKYVELDIHHCEHNPKVLGNSGHPIIQTPNLDALAKRGTVFEHTYTTSPVCIPARAGFATGKYINQIGFWDNADAYDGSIYIRVGTEFGNLINKK